MKPIILFALLSAVSATGQGLDYSKLLDVSAAMSQPTSLERVFMIEITVRNLSDSTITIPSAMNRTAALSTFEFDPMPKQWVHRYAEGAPIAKHLHMGLVELAPGAITRYRVDLRDIFSTIDFSEPTFHLRFRVGGADDLNGVPFIWEGKLSLPTVESKGTMVKM